MIHDRYKGHVRKARTMIRHLGRAVHGSRAFFVFRDRSDPSVQMIACHPPLSDEALLRCLGSDDVVCEAVSEDAAHQAFIGIATSPAFDNRELACEMTTVVAETLALDATTAMSADPVTGLPDRDAFTALLARHAAAKESSTVLVIDVDRIYRVVARFGEAGSTALLRALADRIVDTLPATPVACLGRDKFAALLCHSDEPAAVASAERIHAALHAPFQVLGEELYVTVSIAVAIGATPADSASLLHRGDIGIALATEAGGGTTRVVGQSVGNAPAFALLRERDVRQAVARDQFTTVFQPIVNTAAGGLHAFEVLLRWQHPVEGLLPPSTFLDVLHETGLIDQVGRRVIRDACLSAARWYALSGTLVPVSVNIAPVQLYAPDFCQTVAAALADAGLPSHGLILELTENAFIEDIRRARKALECLRALGVRVLIDDFGTGYSSLTWLHELPVSGIKLDRQWFRSIEASRTQREIVRTIIGLAHFMEMEVVAEGIETTDQLRTARTLECDFAQGFWFAQPLTAEQATHYLATEVAQGVAA